MTETPGLDLLASQRRMWDVIAIAAALVSVVVIVVCAIHAHHLPIVYAIVLLFTFAVFPALVAVSGARRLQGYAARGVPTGDWTRRTGRVGRTRAAGALRTSSPARAFLATVAGVAVVWLLDLAFDKTASLWQLLPLAAFLLLLTVAGQVGTARGASRLAAGLDATRISAVALTDVSCETPLTAGGLLREQASLRYGPELLAAAAIRCADYQGSIFDLMEEQSSMASGIATPR